jgi:hypothetical protein
MKERLDCSLPGKHATVVRRAVARHLERICELKASGFSTVSAEQALEVLLRVLKLFEERERNLRARTAPRQRDSATPRCVSPPLVPRASLIAHSSFSARRQT